MIDQAFEESKKQRNSQVAEMSKEAIVDALEMCAVEWQNEAVRSVALLAIGLIIGDVLNEDFVAGHVQNTATRAVKHPVMNQAVTNSLLKEDLLIGLIATFLSNYIKK